MIVRNSVWPLLAVSRPGYALGALAPPVGRLGR